MKVKLIIISVILLLVVVFVCGCSQFMENIGLINPTNEDQLSPEKGGPSNGLVKVLIGFKEKPGSTEQALVKGAGGKIKYTYHIVDAIAASIPEKAIDALQNNPNIRYVEPDGLVQALDAELDNSWGVKRIGAGIVHDSNKGTGVKVAIIDSGIDYKHTDLDANYQGGKDFVNDDADPMDDNGHGTHVAGTVAALDNDAGVVGVAPEANLYALKVLDSGGSGSFSDVIAALDWCVENGIQVTNNSYGSSVDPGETVKAAFDNAYNEGILHVAAAGNSGNPPGKGDNISYPAAFESVIAVAATNQSDERARWSSTGLELELSAPGVDINSTLLGGGYGEKSGTSMASPHVAGTAALVIVSGISDVIEIRAKLRDTAGDLGAAGWDSKYGHGLVDADEAAGVSGEEPEEPTTGTMHVHNIDMSFKKVTAGPNTFYTAIATVTIVDADGISVEGATVSGSWSDATSDSDSGVTDASGQVSLQSDKVKNPLLGTTFTFTVDDVTKDGWTYNQDANIETSGSITVE
ncbi:MAG TPA: subtilisin [Candidatus Atribacteria bacterium]|jgi:subtilisin|nr:subtilisin [Candidatus Atribacteria bacterium]